MSEIQEDLTAYVEQMAELLNLEISSEYLPGVVENFAAIAKIASLVTEFELPATTEAAPTFEP